MIGLYSLLLTAHSWIRWAVLIVAVLVVARSVLGLFGRRAWQPLDDKLRRAFTIVLDLQVLIGLIMWPFYLSRVGLDMANAASRQMLVEHPLTMLAALALAHIGSARIRRQETDAGRFKQALVFFGLALVLLLLMIPWQRMM
jgi:hypothetical protein